MTYEEAISYIEQACVFGIRPGLDRIQELLRRLGEPQRRYKTIHVTGTNGKGSVSAMIAQALSEAGLRTGRYTSPHLEEYTERISLDGCDISRSGFAEALSVVAGVVQAMVEEGLEQPTEFEMLTAAAFWHFARVHAEYVVVEVGLGGLLDSTNVIVPVVSVVTNVAMDHVKYCGPTLLDIAAHKAGIFKEGVPAVTSAREPALQVIREKAAAKHCPLFVAGEDYGFRERRVEGAAGQTITMWRRDCPEADIHIPLAGSHQAENAMTAVMALTAAARQDERITDGAIARGLAHVQWPGRFQIVQKDGLVLVIDGAHNPAGIHTFCQTYEEVFGRRGRVFLFSVLADKDYTAMVRELFRPEDRVVCAPAPTPRTADPEAMARLLPCTACSRSSLEEGLEAALAMVQSGQVLCIVGSLYIQGGVRRYLRRKGFSV